MRFSAPLLQFIGLISFLISVTIISSYAMYLFFMNSFSHALLGTLLSWSLYVLCLPGAHGSWLIGFPVYFLYRRRITTEPYLWTFMALLNVAILFFAPTYYLTTIPTRLLYSIITHPFPGWIIFLTAFIGTFFYFIVGNKQNKPTYAIIRQLLVIVGYLTFLYISHKYIVIILGISIDA